MTKLLFSLFRLLFTSRIPPILSDSLSRRSWGRGFARLRVRRRWRKGQSEDRFVTRYLISCCCWQGEAVSLRLYITYLGWKRGRGNVRDQLLDKYRARSRAL